MAPFALLALGLLLGSCAAPARDATTPGAVAASSAIAAAPSGASPSNAPVTASAEPSAAADPLLAMELVDVRSGEPFTLAELAADGPVIVETMAIWCTTCRAQMHEMTAAHELVDFHSVSIDVEPSEIAEDLTAYAAQEGFDWPFALADASLATHLRERFGTGVLFPPGTPKLLIRADGSVELLPLNELLSADELAALVSG